MKMIIAGALLILAFMWAGFAVNGALLPAGHWAKEPMFYTSCIGVIAGIMCMSVGMGKAMHDE